MRKYILTTHDGTFELWICEKTAQKLSRELGLNLKPVRY